MKNRFAVLCLCLLAVVVAACQTVQTGTSEPTAGKPTPVVKGTPVPFETIERSKANGTGPEYQGEEPRIIVLTKTNDIAKIEEMISQQAQHELSQVDFNKYIVVAVFQGWKPSSGYGVDILAVARIGERIPVYAVFIEPPPDTVVSDVEISPYQLVKIRKDGMDGIFIFELIVNNAVIQQTEISINQK